MKRSILLTCAVLAAACLPILAQSKGPSIVFENHTKNVASVTEGETIRHVFKFANKGNATLEILDVQASCGCTSTLLSSKKIAPGQSGEISVTIETKELSSLELNKIVTVISNDLQQPQVILTVLGSIVPEFALSDVSMYFGNVPKGQQMSKEILVTIPADKAVKLLSAASTDASVTVRLEPVAGSDGKKMKVVAALKPEAAEGYHFGAILIKTTSQLKPELKIPVRGTVTKGN
jgi:hypothetical protein